MISGHAHLLDDYNNVSCQFLMGANEGQPDWLLPCQFGVLPEWFMSDSVWVFFFFLAIRKSVICC